MSNNIETQRDSLEFVIFNFSDGWKAFEPSYLDFCELKRRTRKVRLVEKGALIAFGYCVEHKNELNERSEDEYYWHCLKYNGGIIYFDYSSGVCETAYFINSCSEEIVLSPQETNNLLQVGIGMLRKILLGPEKDSEPFLLLNSFPFGLSFLVLEDGTVRHAAFLIKEDGTIPLKSSEELYLEDNQKLYIEASDKTRYPITLPATLHNPIKIVVDIGSDYKIEITLKDSHSVNLASYDLAQLIEEGQKFNVI